MADSCIVSKEMLSLKDQTLKSQLYGGGVQNPFNRSTDQQQQQRSLVPSKNSQHWTSPHLYEEKGQRVSPQRVVEHHRTQLKEVTDLKMESFIDEMRQQMLQTQNANVIPQGLLYQQTRMMEKQVEMLEHNQKQMGEVLNNAMNSGFTGPNNPAALRQQVFSENRMMLLDLIAPVTHQLNDVKLMYEHTKMTSQEMMAQMEQIKRIYATQQMDPLYNGRLGQTMGGGGAQTMPEGVIDPRVAIKGIAELKDQMKDLEREAFLIEDNIERQQQERIQKNQQQRYLPKTLTQEMQEHKERLQSQDLSSHLNQQYQVISEAKEAVQLKLGGPFDYESFREDLRLIVADKEHLLREFKASQLWAPEFGDKLLGKVEYDFSVGGEGGRGGLKGEKETVVSYKKPNYYQNLKTEPKYVIDFDLEEIERKQKQSQPSLSKPSMKQTKNDFGKFSSHYGGGHKDQSSFSREEYKESKRETGRDTKKSNVKSGQTKGKKSSPKKGTTGYIAQDSESFDQSHILAEPQQPASKDLRHADILTLKKLVIEEIKSELQLGGGLGTRVQDPGREVQQTFKESKDFPQVRLQGKHEERQEDDLQGQILKELQEAKMAAELEMQKNQMSSPNPAMTESLLANALAELLLNGDGNCSEEEMKKVGEEAMIEKINQILDEVAGQQQQDSQYSARINEKLAGSRRQDLVNTSVQVLDQSLEERRRQQQRMSTQNNQEEAKQNQQVQGYANPFIVPIVIKSEEGKSQNDLLRNPNQLRDLISQTISAQLQMHNLHGGQDDLRRSVVSNETSKTLQEEEAKNKLEQQLLRKQIPINVQPYIQQTVKQGPSQREQYQNPFFFSAQEKGDQYGLQPPLLTDLDQFNMSSSSSEFLSIGSQYSDKKYFHPVSSVKHSKKKRKSSKHQARYSSLSHEQSEGQIGVSESNQSVGEIKGSQLVESKREVNKLAQTINYEEDKEDDKHENFEKPIYDSIEGPVIKGKEQKGRYGRGGMGSSKMNKIPNKNTNIIQSGESFGINPLRSIKAESKQFEKRDPIPQDFLKEEDDDSDNGISEESGELDPGLFA